MEIITIIILFLFCTLLLAAELFILPGTGVAGIAAICCLVGANYFTFVWFGLTTGLWLSAARYADLSDCWHAGGYERSLWPL